MKITLDYTNLFQHEKMPNGLTVKDFQKAKYLCDQARTFFKDKKSTEPLGFYDLPESNIEHITTYIKTIHDKFDTMVVLGIGGSALGNKAVYRALKPQKTLKKLFVYDNVDPYFWEEIVSGINLEKTLFNIISKSGTTAETSASFMYIYEYLKSQFPKDYKQRLIITTDQNKGFLRKIIQNEEFQGFVVPDNVGGRFSVLTDVGLVSSAFVGIDIQSLLNGAKEMKKHCLESDYLKNPALLIALSHILYLIEGKTIAVMMPYSNALFDLADWYRQLWGESLGKRFSLDGREVCTGQTPIHVLGATDQHSQVQLYVEGPKDKIFTFLMVENYSKDFLIPNIFPTRPEVNYLGNKSFSTLLNNECIATELAITEAGNPNIMLKIDEINEENVGAFLYLYEAATVYAGYMLNINPLDQPGVEAGKIATYALMNKDGFSSERERIQNYINEKVKQGKILCLS